MRPPYKFIILIKTLIVFGLLAESKPNWSYEIISIDIDNKTPEVADTNINRNRVSRGIYAVSGIIEIKQDLTDDLLMSGHCFYSPTGSSTYIKAPYQIHKMNITELANTFYKDVLMDSLRDCAENAEIFEDKFVAPLTKRTIIVKNCQISNENMPSVLKTGYYKAIFNFSKQATVSITIVAKVEQN